MPIYEFACEKCNKDFEILVRSAKQEKEVVCPGCGSKKINRKFSTFASHTASSGASSAPACSGVPSSCGRCGTGVPHSH